MVLEFSQPNGFWRTSQQVKNSNFAGSSRAKIQQQYIDEREKKYNQEEKREENGA